MPATVTTAMQFTTSNCALPFRQFLNNQEPVDNTFFPYSIELVPLTLILFTLTHVPLTRVSWVG